MSPRPAWKNPRRSVSSSDLQDRALGVGDPNSADKSAGKANARWARVDLTGGGLTVGNAKEFDVPHDLGQTPTMVSLGHYERYTGPVTISARGVRQEGWSHSHAFVEVTLLAGSAEGCVAAFRVHGR
jgi:hypothetical protein